MPLTPLPDFSTASREPVEPLAIHALGNMRAGVGDLVRLVRAVDTGQVPLNLLNESGLPVLATAVRGWYRLGHYGDPAWVPPPHPRYLARFERGKPWDGTGAYKNFEVLAAALLAAGADPFPDGSLVNLHHAIHSEAPATAVSLLADPACPSLAQADPTSRLLRTALASDEPLLVRALIDAGCDPNALDSGGTPAWFAVRRPNELAWLADAGARLDMVDGQGRAAPQAWSARSEPGATVQALGQALGKLTGGSSTAPIDGAFEAAFALKVGPLRTWLAQDAAALSAHRPVRGLEGTQAIETLTQRVLRVFLASNKFARGGNYGEGSPPMGVLRLLIEHPATPAPDRAAAALVALCYGNTLENQREVGAWRTFNKLAPRARELVQDPGQAAVGWEVLAQVLGHHADGAAEHGSSARYGPGLNPAADWVRSACKMWADLRAAAARDITPDRPNLVPRDAALAAFYEIVAGRDASRVPDPGRNVAVSVAADPPLSGVRPALGALLLAGLSPTTPDVVLGQVWHRAMAVLAPALPQDPALRATVSALLDQVAGAGGFPESLAPQVADLSRQLLDVALEAPAPTRPRVRV